MMKLFYKIPKALLILPILDDLNSLFSFLSFLTLRFKSRLELYSFSYNSLKMLIDYLDNFD